MKTEDYNKLKDLCEANGFELMNESVDENDKWFVVKKIEKAEVKPDGGDARVLIFGFDFNLKAREKYDEIGYWKVCEFLAKQLEDYLNSK